jgi:hypothetical protein
MAKTRYDDIVKTRYDDSVYNIMAKQVFDITSECLTEKEHTNFLTMIL